MRATQSKLISIDDSQVISTATMKGYLKVSVSTDDTLIAEMITSATGLIEKYLGFEIVAKTYEQYIPVNIIRTELLHMPVMSINSVKVYDIDGSVTATLTSPNDYRAKGWYEKEVEILNITVDEETNGTVINYTVGDTVYEPAILTAIERQVAKWYSKRGDFDRKLDEQILQEIQGFRRDIWI